MLIGYARVSTIDQNTDLQRDVLKIAGCQKIFIDKISRVKSDRPELNKLIEKLRKGDTLVVWRIDGLLHTYTSISIYAANSSQVSGIQPFAIANSVANNTANNCKQHNSQKTVNSANR